MNKQIFCEENQKNNNAENFKSDNIIPESLKNKSIKDLEEIFSQIKYPEETNQHLNPNVGEKVENNYEDLEYDKKYECFELFISLELEWNIIIFVSQYMMPLKINLQMKVKYTH